MKKALYINKFTLLAPPEKDLRNPSQSGKNLLLGAEVVWFIHHPSNCIDCIGTLISALSLNEFIHDGKAICAGGKFFWPKLL